MKKKYKTIVLSITAALSVSAYTNAGAKFNFKQTQNPITLIEYNKRICNKEKMVLVYFSADWCPICAKMKPIIADIEKEFNQKMEILRINIDRDKEVTDEFEVDALPVLILYINGEKRWIYVGLLDETDLKSKIETY